MATLTPEQLATVKTDILASADMNTLPANSDGSFAIAALYNKPASPTYFVWRSSVPMSEIMRNGFDWTFVDNLTIGKARIWEWMQLTGTISPLEPNVRAGVIAVFTTAGMASMRLGIFGHCQRAATRLEKLLAVSGSGTTTSDQGIGPATMGYEGTISYQAIAEARNS